MVGAGLGLSRYLVSRGAAAGGPTLALDFQAGTYEGCAVGGSLTARTLAQLVTGATGTATPTASGCLIGASDDVSVPFSPAVFGAGSWFNQSAGTAYAHSNIAYVNTTFPRVFEFTDGTDSNRVIARYNEAVNIGGDVTASGADTELAFTPYSQTVKIAIAWDATGFAVCVNGATVQTSAQVVPTLTALQLGNRGTTKNRQLDGLLRAFKFYPRRLSGAEMITLTT